MFAVKRYLILIAIFLVSGARMKTVYEKAAAVDMNTISAEAITEYPSEPSYANISNDTQHPAPLSLNRH